MKTHAFAPPPPPVARVQPVGHLNGRQPEIDQPVVQETVLESAPGIVLWGRMVSAEARLRKQLNWLPYAANDYHGTLRTALTAVHSLEDSIRQLLKMLDEKAEF